MFPTFFSLPLSYTHRVWFVSIFVYIHLELDFDISKICEGGILYCFAQHYLQLFELLFYHLLASDRLRYVLATGSCSLPTYLREIIRNVNIHSLMRRDILLLQKEDTLLGSWNLCKGQENTPRFWQAARKSGF